MERVFAQIFNAFFSKAVDYFADQGVNGVKNMKDLDLILKTLQQKLKSLSAKAYDVEEEIKKAELSGRKKRKREVEEWLEQVKSIEEEVVELGNQVESEGFIMRLTDGEKAPQLIEQVDKLVEHSRNFGELVSSVCGISEEILLINGMVGEAFNENMEMILELLETRQVSSIGVYGMGGVGKTTLAKNIHNRLLQQSQGRVFWVTVSQEFTVTSLRDKIAHCLGVQFVDEDNEDIRAARLHKALSGMKNSVLILDDVWENIDMSKVGCAVSVECCRLIVTTRSLTVCHQMRCQKMIPVEKLGGDEAWKLFTETLGNEIELGVRVEEIAKRMAKLCDGLPLAIITVAGSMRGETRMHMWENALAELTECLVGGQDGMEEVDKVFEILKYSFDRLNDNHRRRQSSEFNKFQQCFLYCSLYPEDHVINIKYLVSKFISEGLVDQRKNRRAQVHQGHSILDKLVNVCLLESCVVFDGLECVKMHDLVRGMALKIVEGKYMVRAGSVREIPEEQEWAKGVEKVSLMYNGIRRIEDGISPDCPNLSTLLLLEYRLSFISDSFFCKMQGLCTLDLGGTFIKMLPDSISDIKSLKALLLECCLQLKHVPYLGKLKAMRELNLSGTAIEKVPQGLDELLNLKFLSMNAHRLEMLPTGLLLKLGKLQHLTLPYHIMAPIEEIKYLKQVEEFYGGVESVNDFNCFIRSRAHDDTCYSIKVGSHITDRCRSMLGVYNNNACIFRHANLKDEKVLGKDIVFLTICECEGLRRCFVDGFQLLNNHASLKELTIVSCGGIECILRSEHGSLPSQISKTLEEIHLRGLKDLKGVIERKEWETGAASAAAAPAQPHIFSSLKRLSIFECNKMRKVGLPVLGVPNLEYLIIINCGEVEEIFEDEGSDSIITLPKLTRLNLHELPRLKSVSMATMICNSIENICIRKCPSLRKKLPLHVDVPPPPTLKEIYVEREWWESLEWDNPNLPQLLHPLLKYN